MPNPDPLALSYLDQAVAALTMRLHRASVVMLGLACERLILILARAVADADLPPFSKRVAKMLDSPTPISIADVFEQTRRAIVEAAKLPPDLDDAIDHQLTPIFEHARGQRNRQGHPTGDEVTAEDAEAGLLLFPGFYQLVARSR